MFLADDSGAFRARMHAMLGEAPGVQVVGEADDTSSTLCGVETMKPHLVLLDLRMPGGGGLQVLHQLQLQPAAPAVAILSNFAEAAYRHRALRLGAKFYFDKSTEMQMLVQMLRHWKFQPALPPGVLPAVPVTSKEYVEKYCLSK